MYYKKLYAQTLILEKEFKILSKELKNHKLLQTKNDGYTKSNKESFKKLWGKYIIFFSKLQKYIRKSNFRKYIFLKDYNRLVLRKYLLVFYYKCVIDVLKIFGKHKEFLFVFLDENFKKDYGVFAKYIYKPKYVSIINTPNIFIKPMKRFIDPEVYKLLNSKRIDIDINRRILSDNKNMTNYVKFRVNKVLYFLSKHVGKVIAATKFSTRKKGLITNKNIEKYLFIAEPGDIFLTRGNWNASNISIPGFWKHMSMYIGTGKYLKKYYKLKKLDDFTHYIIEATGKGIKIVKLTHLFERNDYLGVSRTSFKKEKIQRAIKNSLKHIGKSYDHMFNFYSDKNLVCSELVLKSYAKEDDNDEGIDIILENIGVNLTYPPNNFIKKLIAEKRKGKKAQVFPVFFIDSIEKTGKNFISSKKKFLESGKRSRLSVFLK